MLGGDPAPDGDYTWHLKANDAWGNPTLDEDGGFTIANEAVPGTAVLSLEPEATATRASSTTFTLTFAGPVTGLTKADFTRTGTARCQLGKPAGGPVEYTITLSECTTGTATLTLASGSVADEAAQLGPAGAIASKITIDRSDPSTSTPRPTLRKGIQIGGAANAPLPMTLSWTGSDTGSGVASYDVRRSQDGGAWDRIANATPATSLQTTVTPGHAYRFMVRARDKAGNVGSWSGGYAWHPRLVQESHGDLTYTGAWSTDAAAGASADATRMSTTAGASVKYTFSGRAVAWVTRLAPSSGEVAVYIDGGLVATIDTHADAMSERFVAFTTGWASYGQAHDQVGRRRHDGRASGGPRRVRGHRLGTSTPGAGESSQGSRRTTPESTALPRTSPDRDFRTAGSDWPARVASGSVGVTRGAHANRRTANDGAGEQAQRVPSQPRGS